MLPAQFFLDSMPFSRKYLASSCEDNGCGLQYMTSGQNRRAEGPSFCLSLVSHLDRF